jgi:hypothetical protein
VSRELILALRRDAVLDPTPLPEDLAALHVPFDQMLGDVRVEHALREAAAAAERIAVVGAMGAGKSSSPDLRADDGPTDSQRCRSPSPRRATRRSPIQAPSHSTPCA